MYVIRQLGGRALGVYVSQALKKGVRYLTSQGVYVSQALKKGIRYLTSRVVYVTSSSQKGCTLSHKWGGLRYSS